MDNKWTLRNVSEDARAMVVEVHEVTGIPYGRLVTEAIERWYDGLPEEQPRPAIRGSLSAEESTA